MHTDLEVQCLDDQQRTNHFSPPLPLLLPFPYTLALTHTLTLALALALTLALVRVSEAASGSTPRYRQSMGSHHDPWPWT